MNRQYTEAKIRDVASEIVKKFQPEKVILFGSYAWGEPGLDSDVDLFIIKDTDDTRQTAREISSLLFPRPFPVDIIVYTPKQVKRQKSLDDYFIDDILSNGKVLYEK